MHAVVQSAFFNYLNRVADAIDLAFDYESPLPRMVKDPARAPLPRPARADWPAGGAFALSLSLRPATAEGFARWRAYVMEREAPLTVRQRRVIARAVAGSLCDARTWNALADAAPRDAGETTLAAYADKLSRTPWRMSEDDLRGLGLPDDRARFDAISVAAHQATASRLALVLG